MCIRDSFNPVHQALHHRETKSRAFLLGSGCIHRLHCLFHIGNAAALVADFNGNMAVRKNIRCYVYDPERVPVSMDDTVCHRLTDGCLDVRKLLDRRIKPVSYTHLILGKGLLKHMTFPRHMKNPNFQLLK